MKLFINELILYILLSKKIEMIFQERRKDTPITLGYIMKNQSKEII